MLKPLRYVNYSSQFKAARDCARLNVFRWLGSAMVLLQIFKMVGWGGILAVSLTGRALLDAWVVLSMLGFTLQQVLSVYIIYAESC